MLFWGCLIIGGVFAWQGLKKGLYLCLATLLCLMVGIYVGVLATPRILKISPEYSNSGYYAAITMLMLALVIFVVLEAICRFSFFSDRDEYFPKLIEQVGGGFCGFLFGYFLLGLVVLSICVMPFSRGKIPPLLPQRDSMVKFASSPVLRVCGFIGWYSLECFDGEPQTVIDGLLTVGQDEDKFLPAPKTAAKDAP
jgi:hypothetical protein